MPGGPDARGAGPADPGVQPGPGKPVAAVICMGTRRSDRTYPDNPEAACTLLRTLFPGWVIDFGCDLTGTRYTARRGHATGWSSADGYSPDAVARGMEQIEEAMPWPS
jgi:hypothetical protein